MVRQQGDTDDRTSRTDPSGNAAERGASPDIIVALL